MKSGRKAPMTKTATHLEVRAGPDELDTLEEARALIELGKAHDRRLQLVGRDGAVELPESLYRALREVVSLLLQQQSVGIVAGDEELTTRQAADILHVSRQHVVDLIDAGKLQAHKAGTHRRVTMRDLLEYRDRRRAAQDAALDDLARLSFDEGMYARRPKRP
jgi:excisionase family DNA binding protein